MQWVSIAGWLAGQILCFAVECAEWFSLKSYRLLQNAREICRGLGKKGRAPERRRIDYPKRPG